MTDYLNLESEVNPCDPERKYRKNSKFDGIRNGIRQGRTSPNFGHVKEVHSN